MIVDLEKSFSDLLLQEFSLTPDPSKHEALTNQYARLRKNFVHFLSDTEDDLLATRRETLDQQYFLDRDMLWLSTIVNETLKGMVESVRYIHEHHLAYMKNLMRRGLLMPDYDGDGAFQRSSTASAHEMDIIEAAVSIRTCLFDIYNIFNETQTSGDLAGIQEKFRTKINAFYTAVNTFESYSLDAQDGILVEELLLNGRKFDKSFSKLVSLEQNKRALQKKLVDKKDHLFYLLRQKSEHLKASSTKINRTIDTLQFVSFLVILFLVSWVIFLGRQIMNETSRTVKEAVRIQRDISYQIQGDENVSSEFQVVFKALNAMAHELNIHVRELQDSESKVNAILQSIGDYMFMLDKDLTIIWANNIATSQFGRRMVGQKCYHVLHDRKEACEPSPCLTKRTLQDGAIHQQENQTVDRDGKPIIMHCTSNVALRDDEGRPTAVIEICRDITRERKTEAAIRDNEEKLARSKRMESIGLMAGGIAHDLNNILSGIVSYPDLLLMDLPDDSPLVKPLKVMKDSGERAANIVSDLLTVARGVATGKEVMNLNHMVEEYAQSAEFKKLERTNPAILFTYSLDADLLNVKCSPTHIKKTLMNLVTNAAEAIKGDGAVVVKTMNRYLDEPLIEYEDVRQGEYALLSVADNGAGISAGDLKKIFEPFYTRKVMGRSGTGLGLAVVWNTVRDHDGYINVKSGDEGTLFELYFPITREAASAQDDFIPIADYRGNGETILVVDDERQQQEIAQRLLHKLGYEVETVGSGEAAIEHLKRHPVDLIVLDMIMFPGMNGRETYEKALNINATQKAIIASGFAETEEVKLAQRRGAGKFIKKPYTIDKIGIAVKEELLK
jgi:PAS domain S-box-containing protein